MTDEELRSFCPREFRWLAAQSSRHEFWAWLSGGFCFGAFCATVIWNIWK